MYLRSISLKKFSDKCILFIFVLFVKILGRGVKVFQIWVVRGGERIQKANRIFRCNGCDEPGQTVMNLGNHEVSSDSASRFEDDSFAFLIVGVGDRKRYRMGAG